MTKNSSWSSRSEEKSESKVLLFALLPPVTKALCFDHGLQHADKGFQAYPRGLTSSTTLMAACPSMLILFPGFEARHVLLKLFQVTSTRLSCHSKTMTALSAGALLTRDCANLRGTAYLSICAGL